MNQNPYPPGTPLSKAGGLPPIREKTTSPVAATNVTMQQVVIPTATDRWGGQIAKQYTPERVESVLRGAMSGDLTDVWRLFDLMEDTSPRISKNLNQRKRAVMNYVRTFNSFSEEDEPAKPEADLRKKVAASALWRMRPQADKNENGFDDTIYDVLDAVGKGVALLEVDWETRDAGKLGIITAPRATRYIHPQYYGYPPRADWIGLNIPNITSARSMSVDAPKLDLNLPLVDGVYARLPENKFLVCTYKSKSGHPTGTALLRRLAFWWAASNFTQSWFLNFAQIFGLPIRWANYDPNTPGLLEKVCAMLENMGSAAWGAFPAGTSLELKEPPKSSSENPQVVLLNMADKQYDLAILGQSGTTEISGPGKTGGSNAANQVLQGVEETIVRADAKFICKIFNEQLIPMIIRLNYGDEQMMPELDLQAEVIEDITGLVTNYGLARTAGAITPNPDDEEFLRKKLSLPAMSSDVAASWKKSDNVRLQISSVPGQPPPGQNDDAEQEAIAHAHASNVANEKIVNSALEDFTGVSEKWLGSVKPFFQELIAKAKDEKLSDADFVTALAKAKKEIPELFGKLKSETLAEVFENAMASAAVNGAARGFMDRRKAVGA
ncbi:MAG TPA: DUF935 family protein [Verrucomicrobiae bacterium]|nr:DUF935 family protein [Verrucomicrobiae bacterium]